MKTCSKCYEEKELEAFHKRKTGPDGRRGVCKACRSKQDKLKYNPDKNASEMLNRKFGITLEDYDDMLHQQHGVCQICGTDNPKGKGRFHVDHNHATGKVRGLLCHNCNTGLGHFKDNPDLLQEARDYLMKEGHYG